MNKENKKSEDLEKLIDAGSEIAGSVSGAAIGLALAGPPGALIGAVGSPILTRVFQKLGTEFQHRYLGKRQITRIGATLAFAAEKMKVNNLQGLKLREDDFLKESTNERAAAEEIAEGVLLASQDEHEEKKLRLYGNLLANIAYHPEIDKAQANLLIRVAEALSYRQLCLLCLFAFNFGLRDTDYRSESSIDQKKASILHEIYDLYTKGLLNCSGNALLGLADIQPAKMKLQGTGGLLFNLMELIQLLSDATDLTNLLK